MPTRVIQIIALTLTALGLAPGAAHLMELPVKLAYSPLMYAEVTSTLYAWFGPLGGTIQVAATIVVAVVAFQARRSPGGRLLAASAAALVVSLLLWASLVAPVNSVWANTVASSPDEFIEVYDNLRARWEYGHVAAFIAWLTGWFGLVASFTTRPLSSTSGAN